MQEIFLKKEIFALCLYGGWDKETLNCLSEKYQFDTMTSFKKFHLK